MTVSVCSLALAAVLVAVGEAGQPELRPVDQGLGDVSPASTSERLQEVDARQPAAFERVYEIVSPDGKTSFVRVSGALYAEFDQSWYSSSGQPLVPPGTRFSIGRPASLTEQTVTPNRAPNAVSLRADGDGTRSDRAISRRTARPVPVGEASMFSNELYRRVRISQLLQAALKPSGAGSQDTLGRSP